MFTQEQIELTYKEVAPDLPEDKAKTLANQLFLAIKDKKFPYILKLGNNVSRAVFELLFNCQLHKEEALAKAQFNLSVTNYAPDKIIIQIQGGNIVAISGKNPNVSVEIVDWDAIIPRQRKQGATKRERNAFIAKIVSNLKKIDFSIVPFKSDYKIHG